MMRSGVEQNAHVSRSSKQQAANDEQQATSSTYRMVLLWRSVLKIRNRNAKKWGLWGCGHGVAARGAGRKKFHVGPLHFLRQKHSKATKDPEEKPLRWQKSKTARLRNHN